MSHWYTFEVISIQLGVPLKNIYFYHKCGGRISLNIALKQNKINRLEGNKLLFDFQIVLILFDPRLFIEVTSISLI